MEPELAPNAANADDDAEEEEEDDEEPRPGAAALSAAKSHKYGKGTAARIAFHEILLGLGVWPFKNGRYTRTVDKKNEDRRQSTCNTNRPPTGLSNG